MASDQAKGNKNKNKGESSSKNKGESSKTVEVHTKRLASEVERVNELGSTAPRLMGLIQLGTTKVMNSAQFMAALLTTSAHTATPSQSNNFVASTDISSTDRNHNIVIGQSKRLVTIANGRVGMTPDEATLASNPFALRGSTPQLIHRSLKKVPPKSASDIESVSAADVSTDSSDKTGNAKKDEFTDDDDSNDNDDLAIFKNFVFGKCVASGPKMRNTASSA